MNVFDFDETIFDGDTAFEFMVDFIKKNPSLLKLAPDIIKVVRDYKNLTFRFEDLVDQYGPMISDLIVSANVDAKQIAKEFWDKRERKIKPFYFEIQKEDDLVISASPTFMLEEICNRIGIKHFLGTEMNLEKGTFERWCFRDKKIEFFREAYPDGVIDDFYTDSLHDEFLFPYAKRVFLVKGNKITQIK